MEVEVDVDEFLGLVDVGMGGLGLVLALGGLLGFLENGVDLFLDFGGVGVLLPAEDLEEKDLAPPAGDEALALELLLEDLGVVLVEDLPLEGGDEGEVVLAEDVAGDQHRQQVVVLDLYQLLHQVHLPLYYAVLQDHYVVVGVHLPAEHLRPDHPHLPASPIKYVSPTSGFGSEECSPMKPSFPKKYLTPFPFSNLSLSNVSKPPVSTRSRCEQKGSIIYAVIPALAPRMSTLALPPWPTEDVRQWVRLVLTLGSMCCSL